MGLMSMKERMANKKVIIIGAGITGLCSGINLRNAGYDVEIFEMHSLPGGMCTAWSKKGYTFDGCIDWLLGSSPDGFFYDMWREMGALDDSTNSVEYEIFSVTELSSGKNFVIYTDPEKLREEMLALAPEDRGEINKLIGLIKTFSGFRIASGFFGAVRMGSYWLLNLRKALMFRKLFRIDIEDYVKQYKNKELAEALIGSIDGKICAATLIMMFGFMAKKSAGYITGGSLQFAKRIEQKYISLGGKVTYNSRVKEIIVENGKATGIRMENGKEYNAGYIVSAADGYDTIYRMLKGKYTTPLIEEAYSKWALFPGTCQVSIGVARDFNNEPPNINFILKNKIIVDPKSGATRISVQIFNFDPTMAPKGKTALTLMIPADYEYWAGLRKVNRREYDKQKERIALEVVEALNARFPGLKERVEVVDFATPATYERYNNEWKGSWEGFWPNAYQIRKSLPSKLPGLSNFRMGGQWLKPGGGLPTALMEGKRICKEIQKAG